MLAWLLLGSCALLHNDYPPRNCDDRLPYYPDADGNGLGERTDVYLGCSPPPGWVAVLEPLTSADTGDTGGAP